jgi:carboxyl-terminal processing protease
MPDDVLHPVAPTPAPRPTTPAKSSVDPAVTDRQLGLLDELWGAVKADYVFPDYNGVDWDAIRIRYRTVVSGGLTDADFYTLMNQLIAELGDQHSYYLDPDEARSLGQVVTGSKKFVGIGVNFSDILAPDGLPIVFTYPGAAAETAGLRAHDVIVAKDGEPMLDANGERTAAAKSFAGDPGTTVVVTVRHPDGRSEDLSLVRTEFTSATPVPFCRVPGTRIGYVLIATLYDETLLDGLREALRKMSADGPLDGLIIDNREDGGGLAAVLVPILSLFMEGRLGFFASRTILLPLASKPEDVAGSQSVPLAVLIGDGTNSFGEVMSGVLQQSDGAITVGQKTRGNVEVLRKHEFSDNSQAWIAQELFVPVQTRYGPWDKTGIRADASAPTRWDLYAEANDPGLAAAVAALQGR